METSVQRSETTARELRKALLLQSEAILAQSQAQETILLNANISKTLIEQSAITAADLKSKIEDASLRFRQTSGFLGFLWRIGEWVSGALCVFFILLLILGTNDRAFKFPLQR